MKTAVIITTRNEADNIAFLVAILRKSGHAVVVVDESSSDGTPYIAKEAGADVHCCEAGMGIGPCLMSGWSYAWHMDFTRIVQMDAGGSHDPADLPKLLKASQNHDMVIGSRFIPGSEYHGRPFRANLSALYTIACNAITGARIHDWTSGYRVFSRHAIETLISHDYKASMHSWQTEVLAIAHHAGLSVIEVPITYTAGRSSFNRHIAIEAIKTLWHIAASKGKVNANRVGVNLPQ